jgi:hypothetical protein
MAERAPEPSAIMAMTDATPITTPSMVSAERTRLRRSALPAMRSVLPMVTGHLQLDRRQRRELLRRLARVRDLLVLHHPAVAERDHPVAVLGDVGLVGDQDDRDVLLADSAAAAPP